MKEKSAHHSPEELELSSPSTEEIEETDLTGEDDDESIYSDDFLDSFMRTETDDSDSYSFGFKRSQSDGDDDFDSYFRDADGYSHGGRRRRHRSRGRHPRESFEFDFYEAAERSDWRSGNGRRPRR